MSILSLIFLSLSPFFFIAEAQSSSSAASAPTSDGTLNITAILAKAGQFNTFIRFLRQTQVGNQINNQINNSNEGMTVLAPTDNAFQSLSPGTINRLSEQQKVQLILYHVLPKFYTFEDLSSVSNPARTQASGQEGQVFGLNFTGEPNQNQVNVTSGRVNTTINNVIRKDFPLAVYQLDKVMLPMELFEPHKASPPSATMAPPPMNATTGSDSGDSGKPSDKGPSASPSNGSKRMNVGLGFISGLTLLCMGLLS